MKKYMKNRNFIPEKFYKRKVLIKNKKEKRFLVMMLILNLIIIPTTTKNIGGINKTTSVSKYDINSIKSNNIEREDINIWLESMLNDDIEFAYINKNNGEITIDDLKRIDELSSNKAIRIDEINLKEDGKYKLVVSLNE